MIITQIVYDVLTNKKYEEEIEVPIVEDMPNQEVQLSIEERLDEIEKSLSTMKNLFNRK